MIVFFLTPLSPPSLTHLETNSISCNKEARVKEMKHGLKYFQPTWKDEMLYVDIPASMFEPKWKRNFNCTLIVFGQAPLKRTINRHVNMTLDAQVDFKIVKIDRMIFTLQFRRPAERDVLVEKEWLWIGPTLMHRKASNSTERINLNEMPIWVNFMGLDESTQNS